MIGNPIADVAISTPQNVSGTTSAAILKNSVHQRTAANFLKFITEEVAAAIYRNYGFEPIEPNK